MFPIALVFVFILFSVTNASLNKDTFGNKLMGVKAYHSQIDKNTIISSNMVDNKYRGNDNKYREDDPNWSYSSFPNDVTNHVSQFKRNMSECLKEVQAEDKRTVKPLSPKRDSPVHGECLIACVLKRNGVIRRGKVYKENLLSLVYKFFAKENKLMKKLEKGIDRCINTISRTKDECKIAARLNECTNEIMAYSKNKIMVNY